MKHKLGILSLFFSFYFFHTANSSDTKDSATSVLHNLSDAYQKGKLSEKDYLDTVHNTMRTFLSRNIFFTHKELLQMLDPYRQLIWENKKNEGRKREYYGILSNQAQMSGRSGEMLYYAEKIDKFEQETKKRQSLTALSIIAIYYDAQRSNEEIKALYEKEKKYLQRLPVIFDKEKLDENDLVQASIILEIAARALYELNDTRSGAEAESLLEQFAAIANAKYKKDIDVIVRITVSQMLAFYRGAVARDSPLQMQEAFRRMEALLTDKNTPEYIKPYIQLTIADAKTAYYIHYANNDSAARYLDRYEEMMKDNPNLYNGFVLKKYKARLLYNQGKYKESADLYETALATLDSSRSLLVKDIDNMMYARAETEEQQLLLADAAVRNRQAERRFFMASAAIALLLIGGMLSIQYIRKRQKNKLVEFKLNMARNIHDETNPALLYAKALIKASRSDEHRETANAELESHIGHTMELIRSLSHDLKSDRQYVLNDLLAKTEQTLKKLNTGGDFTFTIQTDIDKKRFISHYQFSQLMSVLHECITNTIKHASFDKIKITFTNSGNKLTITYSDNGKGWATQQANTGIGVRNMEERILQINGEWQIENDYPNGYRIYISSLLR